MGDRNGELSNLDEAIDGNERPGGWSFGVIGFARERETTASLFGAGVVAAGNDAEIAARGAVIAAAGNDMTFSGVAGMVATGNRVTINDSTIGVLFAGSEIEGDNVRVVMGAPQAAACGAAFGAVFAVLFWLLRRS